MDFAVSLGHAISEVQATVLQEELDDREGIYLPSPFLLLLRPALTYGYPFRIPFINQQRRNFRFFWHI